MGTFFWRRGRVGALLICEEVRALLLFRLTAPPVWLVVQLPVTLANLEPGQLCLLLWSPGLCYMKSKRLEMETAYVFCYFSKISSVNSYSKKIEIERDTLCLFVLIFAGTVQSFPERSHVMSIAVWCRRKISEDHLDMKPWQGSWTDYNAQKAPARFFLRIW